MPVLKQNEVFAGRYVLSNLLGEGGFSEVWKARDEMADEAVVAIKIYAPGKGLDEYGLRQFRNEFSLTHNLSHPHLLKVYHFDIAEGSPYLIMPLCPFGSLTNVVREEGVFSERQAALVMCQIGSALEEVHRQNPPIIHQDIKPDNILLMHSECFMLADFGISSRIQHTLRKATDNMQSLTVAYAPPERFDRHPSSDPSSDIFSLGVTLYEMCTNTIPWEGAGGQCLLKGAHVPALPKTFSPELNKILESCMSLDRSKRPTAAEIHLRGRHYLETGNWQMPKQRKKKAAQKKGIGAYLLAAAAVALIALGGAWFYKYEYPKHDFSAYTFGWEKASPAPDATAEPATNASQLEDKLSTMEAQLVKATQQLVLQDSINNMLVKNKDAQLEETKQRLAKEAEAQMTSQKREEESKPAAAAVAKPAAGKTLGNLPKEIQKNLNRISDPEQAKAVRSGWKQETLSRFADGAALVVDESDGKEYRAGIFLTLLLSSPHRVVVKEVKTDGNNKITELRLTKQPL